MKIYVYPTDRQWFDFLRQRTILDEINFWQPGGGRAFSQLQPGELFLFRLKSPVDRIAGGGFYLHSSVLPLGLAWDAFEEKNGTPDFATFRRLIASYKKVSPPEQLPLDSMIGCIVRLINQVLGHS